AERIAASEQARRRMLTDLAHEMRTPIASLRVTVEALEDGFVDLDEHTVSVFHDQLSRLTRLASDIKDVSAAEEGRLDLHRELVDLSEVL
ncbi:histidine kinase dimerization/phospho-acceptor domain-containing protein, partial [Bacillus subtilis]|uniref:histidine kinase dimerization/phospho-acceptor domain-containing protein n=3 Tax=Bacillati TaxID=1783272 RepID=UPI0029E7F0CE